VRKMNATLDTERIGYQRKFSTKEPGNKSIVCIHLVLDFYRCSELFFLSLSRSSSASFLMCDG
jgi:hypothetical protein